jgi:hypothetical protein
MLLDEHGVTRRHRNRRHQHIEAVTVAAVNLADREGVTARR